MQTFKNKLYNYEASPPEGMWDKIKGELENEKTGKVKYLIRRSKFVVYTLSAAASLAIIFTGIYIFTKNKDARSVAEAPEVKIDKLLSQKAKDSIALNHQILETIINLPEEKKLLAFHDRSDAGQLKKYITIAGPEGEAVKISPKAATLILSADNDYPPKPVWNKKINKWKQIMLSNTMPPTSTSLVDILLLAANSDNIE